MSDSLNYKIKRKRAKGGRSPARDAVIETLRRQIVDGSLRPGTRLPIRSELESQFKVSGVTLQGALDYLARDGFVLARGKLGTFVTEIPPFLNTYALVTPFHPGLPQWTGFWTALLNEAVGLQPSQGRKVIVYHDIMDSEGRGPSYDRLLHDVRNHRVAGLMFASSPHLIKDTPLMREPGIPRVSTTAPSDLYPKMWNVSMDGNSFVEKAIDHLTARGRKRIAVLRTPGLQPQSGQPDSYVDAIHQRGLTTHEHWQQYVFEGAPWCARNCVSMLVQGSAGERPDGLVIADDNLVEHAIAGLMMAGVRVGLDLDVVVHANFPLPSPSGLPVRRLGFDARQVLERCIEAIDRQRKGETERQVLTVPALWEDEVTARTE